MIERLERLVDEIGAVHSKLILLVGAPRTDKTALLCTLAKSRNATSLNIRAALSSRLSAILQKQRHLQANTILRELTDQHAKGDLFLVDTLSCCSTGRCSFEELAIRKGSFC